MGHFPRFHEDKGLEISVNPVRMFGRGFKPLTHCIFSKLRPFGRRLLSNGVNISRITGIPTPESPPKRGLSTIRIREVKEYEDFFNWQYGLRRETDTP